MNFKNTYFKNKGYKQHLNNRIKDLIDLLKKKYLKYSNKLMRMNNNKVLFISISNSHYYKMWIGKHDYISQITMTKIPGFSNWVFWSK